MGQDPRVGGGAVFIGFVLSGQFPFLLLLCYFILKGILKYMYISRYNAANLAEDKIKFSHLNNLFTAFRLKRRDKLKTGGKKWCGS